jgi:hypothetical protein
MTTIERSRSRIVIDFPATRVLRLYRGQMQIVFPTERVAGEVEEGCFFRMERRWQYVHCATLHVSLQQWRGDADCAHDHARDLILVKCYLR